MKPKKITELNQLYAEATTEDKELYSEMRSNILLVAGEHYAKRAPDKFFTNLRNTKDISDTQKLRITKNHVQKIAHHYEEAIMSQSPWVRVVPQLDSELQDQKDAELNQSVWEYTTYKQKLRDKVREWVKDYVEIGEVAVKIFWDPSKGEFLGYGQKVNEAGEPEVDEMGQPVPDDDQAIFSGEIEFERIFGFNLFRAPGAKSMHESNFVGIRKMVDLKELKEKYEDDPEKSKYIQEASKEEFVVFDSARGNYRKTKDQCLVKEFYFKPCHEHPQGYFYITTESGILEEGELPFGIFPIVWRGFDTYPTRPRGYSVIKRIRPYQAELNRASSQQATHQVTLADDKVIYQAGTKLSPGALLPGVRGITYQGAAPTILPGRTGEQFTGYIAATIDEMYSVAELEELNEDNANTSQVDPWATLYRNMRQKKKFSKYGDGFEQFLLDVCETTLKTLKSYLPDDAVIQMVGRKEQVNIPEFKSTTPLCYQIKVVPVDETLESQMGKQLTITHVLQYVGKQLPQESIGKLMKSLPFGNLDDSFDEFTVDADNVKNDMLAIERGEPPPFSESDNHEYYIKRLNARIKKADFKYLAPEIQEAYQQKLQMHEQADAAQKQQILAAKNEMIPTSGPMVGVDLYVENKDDPSKAPKRARLPSSAVEWLVKTMEAQGQTLEKLEKYDQNNLASIAQMLLSSQGAQASAQGGMNGQSVPSNGGQPGL
jgi:hypothetical protein